MLLVQPWTAQHPEWLLAAINSRGVNPAWLISNLLTLPHWQGNADFIRASIQRGEDLNFLIDNVLLPNWKDRPEFSEFISAIVEKKTVDSGVANKILTQEWSVEHPEWVSALIKNGKVHSSWFAGFCLTLPHWRGKPEFIRLLIEKGESLDILMEKVLIPDWKDSPEFPKFVLDILAKRDWTEAVGRQILTQAWSPKYLELLQAEREKRERGFAASAAACVAETLQSSR